MRVRVRVCVFLIRCCFCASCALSYAIDCHTLLTAIFSTFTGRLDVYYLSLEKRFRCSYNRFVESLHSAADDSAVRIFEVKPEPQFFGAVLRSIFSISVAPFYFLIFVICFALAKI
jgi:hypothetical protein